MFQQLKNIDTAFKHVKAFTIVVIIVCLCISAFALTKSYEAIQTAQDRIYILANGKIMEAFTASRKDNIQVEARDHVETFHQYFFSLDPDDQVIESNIRNALYLADESAKSQYDNLKEKGYYADLIAANISQSIKIDSIVLDVDQYPYSFRCYATQELTRSTSQKSRVLVTEGFLRSVSRSDNNPHGFLIEQWRIIDNSDHSLKQN